MKIGIYPGTFNPFHVGHNNIYEKAKKIFDKVFIARGINPSKTSILDNLPEFTLNTEYDGLLTDCIKDIWNVNKSETKLSEIFVIRGFRNLDDIKYQQEQDYWLKRIDSNFQSIYIECDEEFKYISSSAIKNLNLFNQDTKYLTI